MKTILLILLMLANAVTAGYVLGVVLPLFVAMPLSLANGWFTGMTMGRVLWLDFIGAPYDRS